MSNMRSELLGWHFIDENRRLGYGDGREVKVGETLTVEPPIELCFFGLHASEKAIDALGYARGPLACRVRLSGEIKKDEDKAVATERTVLKMVDATEALRQFMRFTLTYRQLRVAELFENADLAEHAEVIRRLDMGTATIEDIEDVFADARDAAWKQGDVWGGASNTTNTTAVGAGTNPWNAMRVATEAIHRGVPWAIAWDAASAGAWCVTNAARISPWTVTRDAFVAASSAVRYVGVEGTQEAAAWTALNAELERLLLAAIEKAAVPNGLPA